MTSLSVVVASPTPDHQRSGCVAALLAELQDDDEIVWSGAAPPAEATKRVRPESGSRGAFYRAGLDAASAATVAFTDTATVVQSGWRAAVDAAIGSGAAVTGGPVLPSRSTPRRHFAGFVVEYGPHAAPPYVSATGDVAANNVAYVRDALISVLSPDEPVWKSVVDARLRACGHPPLMNDGMRAVSTKTYRWRDVLAVRARHGRLYGAQRAAEWRPWQRAVGGVACAALPAVAAARLAPTLLADAQFRRPFLEALPVTVLALAAWSLGEAAGLWTAREPSGDVF